MPLGLPAATAFCSKDRRADELRHVHDPKQGIVVEESQEIWLPLVVQELAFLGYLVTLATGSHNLERSEWLTQNDFLEVIDVHCSSSNAAGSFLMAVTFYPNTQL
jgi:hypothetical protein